MIIPDNHCYITYPINYDDYYDREYANKINKQLIK